jgi:hypothetical protein
MKGTSFIELYVIIGKLQKPCSTHLRLAYLREFMINTSDIHSFGRQT